MKLNGKYRIHTFTEKSGANHLAETVGELVDAVLFSIKHDQQFEISLITSSETLGRTCEHGKGLTDYCEPCWRVSGGS